MDGMPIQYLDGVGDEPAFELKDLVARRNDIAANPAKYAKMQNPTAMLRMYDYAIKYWNTPLRDKALAVLDAEEERLTADGSILSGIEGLDGRFFKKIKKIAKKVARVSPTAIITRKTIKIARKAAKVVAPKRKPVAPARKPVAVVRRPVVPVAPASAEENEDVPYTLTPTVETEQPAMEPAPPPEEAYSEPAEEEANTEPTASDEPAESTPEDAEAVGYISGLSEDVLNLVNGLGGGLNGTEDDDQKVLQHLIQTRDIIRAKPSLVASVQNPEAMLKMFDYAIKHFNTPNRDKALGFLEQEEERLLRSGAILNGFEDAEVYGIDGLDGKFWSKVKKAVSKGAKGVVAIAKKAGNLMLVLNPITIAARNGLLVAMKLNMNHMASKLAPAYLTADQAKAEGISPADHKKAQDALEKVRSLFQKKLRGNSSSLKKAILSGKRKKWRKPVTLEPKALETDVKNSSVDTADLSGLGVVIAAGSVAAATPFIVKVTTMIKGLFNNKEKQEFLEEAEKAGKSKKDANADWKKQKKTKKGGSGINLTKVTDLINDARELKSKTPATDESITSNSNSENNMDNPNPSFLQQHGKKLAIGAAVVVAGVIAYKMLNKKNAPASSGTPQALNGIHRRRKVRKRKATRKISTRKPTRKAIGARRKARKVKSVKLR